MATAMAAAMATTMAMVAAAATPPSHGDPPLGHAAVHGHGGGGQNAPKICVSKSSKSMGGGVAIAGCEPWTDGHGFSSEVFPL